MEGSESVYIEQVAHITIYDNQRFVSLAFLPPFPPFPGNPPPFSLPGGLFLTAAPTPRKPYIKGVCTCVYQYSVWNEKNRGAEKRKDKDIWMPGGCYGEPLEEFGFLFGE